MNNKKKSLQRRQCRSKNKRNKTVCTIVLLVMSLVLRISSSFVLVNTKNNYNAACWEQRQQTTTCIQNRQITTFPSFALFSMGHNQQQAKDHSMTSSWTTTVIKSFAMSILILVSPMLSTTTITTNAWAESETEILETRSPSKTEFLDSRSIVFDSMDEEPEIEEEIAQGSKTKIVKLHEVPQGQCVVSTEKGDVVEIDFVAKRLYPPVTVYDASIFRGTGQPFKFVLGSGVMIPGVDQGMYNMCPGEVRLLKIPPRLAVGLLDPPAKAPLEWQIELVSIDGIIRQENNNGEFVTREERE